MNVRIREWKHLGLLQERINRKNLWKMWEKLNKKSIQNAKYLSDALIE